VLESGEARSLLALVLLLVVLAACLAGGLMQTVTPTPAAPSTTHELVDLTSDTTGERAAERIAR
jgi:hypothetical protein